MQPLLLILAGLALGAFGTLIGAGGGFLLVPALALAMPHEPSERIASLSLLIVAVNAASGSHAYARRGQVHFRSGWIFAAAAVPGAAVGTFMAPLLPRTVFDVALGLFLLGMSALIAWRTRHAPQGHDSDWTGPSSRQLASGAAVSVAVGLLSSILGIGGGIIHVPLLAYLLGFPVHRATATSHFVLAITAGMASALNIADGRLFGNWSIAIPLAVGVLAGAQVGAHFAPRIHARWIILALCGAIALVGARLSLRSLMHEPPAKATKPL